MEFRKRFVPFCVFLLFHFCNCAIFSTPERGACRGENPEGQGVRLYTAEVDNVSEGKDQVEECRVSPITINGTVLNKPQRCTKNLFGVSGEFLIADKSCNVNRSWILEELSDLLEISFSCDWSKWPSRGCNSLPDRFQKECVFLDYCYASPWMWTRDFEGKSRCDNRFKDLLVEECQGDIGCRAMTAVVKVGVWGFASSSWNSAQKQLRFGKVKCERTQRP